MDSCHVIVRWGGCHFPDPSFIPLKPPHWRKPPAFLLSALSLQCCRSLSSLLTHPTISGTWTPVRPGPCRPGEKVLATVVMPLPLACPSSHWVPRPLWACSFSHRPAPPLLLSPSHSPEDMLLTLGCAPPLRGHPSPDLTHPCQASPSPRLCPFS